jgi:putative hydrolase of the HAD superfamily
MIYPTPHTAIADLNPSGEVNHPVENHNTSLPPWNEIHTVLLDMDGTLLDLHFDNYFWQVVVPHHYAMSRGLDVVTARAVLQPLFDRAAGQLNWYCVDYWTRELNLDISALKNLHADLIQIKPDAQDFLERLRCAGKRTVLVTNAHPKSLAIKLQRTQLHRWLDAVVSAHEVGVPKEDTNFWVRLKTVEPFNPVHTLLIDDNLRALHSALRFGIRYLYAVAQPSSRAPSIPTEAFPAITSFQGWAPY